MLHSYFPLLFFTVISIFWLVKRLLLAEQQLRRLKILSRRLQPNAQKAREAVRDFGVNSNSFMMLYGGFQYYCPLDKPLGIIGYVETANSWVGAAEPLANEQNIVDLLRAFSLEAHAAGKVAMFIPVRAHIAELAKKVGYQSLMIGVEPTFDLRHYPPLGQDWLDVVPTAKTFAAKDAQVRELMADLLTAEQRRELDAITVEWLESRKMAPLSFLNRVEPWTLSQDKKYFSIEVKGRILAYIAAIPIWPRKAWYLIDIIKRQDTPPGSTELLILETIRLLKEQGAFEISLGVAPLAGLGNAPDKKRWIYKILNTVYKKGGFFYNFNTLHEFKMKFAPTSSEAMFLIYNPPRLSLRLLSGLSDAFQPEGVKTALWSRLARLRPSSQFSRWLKAQLNKNIVVRAAPSNFRRLLLRCRFTVTMMTLNILAFLVLNNSSGTLPSDLEQQWGFSWQSLSWSEPYRFFAPAFLHWNLGHLIFNLICMVLFTGTLEYLTGTGLVIISYFIPSCFANLISVAGFSLTLKYWDYNIWLKMASEMDVGASLGTFGCAGALSLFLKHGRLLRWSVMLVSVILCILRESALSLNHIVAFFIGLVTVHIYLNNQDRLQIT